MPLLKQCQTEGGEWAIWQIAETEPQLLKKLGTNSSLEGLQTLTHPARRCEWLAVRLLFKTLFGTLPDIQYASSGKPYLPDGFCHISISHTKGYAAVACHPTRPVGVDIEQVGPRVLKVAHRFLHSDEDCYMRRDPLSYNLLAWSAKETLFKILDRPNLDFKEQLRLLPFPLQQEGEMNALYCGDELELHFHVHYRQHPAFVFTWCFQ